MGRKPLGAVAMTPLERQRKHRARRKIDYVAYPSQPRDLKRIETQARRLLEMIEHFADDKASHQVKRELRISHEALRRLTFLLANPWRRSSWDARNAKHILHCLGADP